MKLRWWIAALVVATVWAIELPISWAGRDTILLALTLPILPLGLSYLLAVAIGVFYVIAVVVLWRRSKVGAIALFVGALGVGASGPLIYEEMANRSDREAREKVERFLANPSAFKVEYTSTTEAAIRGKGKLTPRYSIHPYGKYTYEWRSAEGGEYVVLLNDYRDGPHFYVYPRDKSPLRDVL